MAGLEGVETLASDMGKRVEFWRGALEELVGDWVAAWDAACEARREASRAVRQAGLALARTVERETGLTPAGFARHEAAMVLGLRPGSPAARRHREAVRRSGAEVRRLREALDDARLEAARAVEAADVRLAAATRELLAYCPEAGEVVGLSLDEMDRLARWLAPGPSPVTAYPWGRPAPSGDRAGSEKCRPEGGRSGPTGGTMTESRTKARAQALAREAMAAGTTYEKAVAARDAAVARRHETLARLDQAVADAEAAVVEAVAKAANLLGPVAAAVVLGLDEAEVRRAARATPPER